MCQIQVDTHSKTRVRITAREKSVKYMPCQAFCGTSSAYKICLADAADDQILCPSSDSVV